MSMEEPLVEKEDVAVTRKVFVDELKEASHIAIPMIIVTVSQYLLRVSPMIMLGHLGELSLSSASIATSLSNVTGYSLLFGMSSALETLCGQAYGAGQYRKLGTYTYSAIICLFLVCIPVSVLWIFTDKLLILMGQDPSIAAEAGKYAIWLIPTLFPYAILQSLVRYLQAQSIILPMLINAVASLCFQVTVCWAFIFKLNLGSTGAALSIGLSYWLNVILLMFYVKYSSACEKTRASFSRDVFLTIGDFFRFAIPSAVMVCLEWWSFEIIILLSGLLPNPMLETSVLSICFTTTSVHYHVPYSFGAAASTRVSNELGAGRPQAAKIALAAVIVLSATEVVLASITLFAVRHVWGSAFTYEKEVVTYVAEITPILCISIIMDGTQAVLSGVARGSGWQHIGAYVNLGAYYLVGIPAALLLGFVLHLNGKGLWSGLVAGTIVQSISLSLVTGFTNWEKQAIEARGRIFNEKLAGENQFIE
ncbi:MATE efflux family protein 8 [Capsicum annuum]|uniref:protein DETOXIFICATION 9 n=1 Tax=Capsicum annuum TaxID=4072 RepID=UPI0007BF986B|nr:protein DETOXIFICATION 9 [Capsicum annuum]KAF3613190.1 MATE efflux family protein 8 [Capsicum annuum]KAF3672063.1 MATE efflux family protein 8 [Capsicum annuum]